MNIEDRVRAALRKRAEQVREAPSRWGEIAVGRPPPPRNPQPRRALAAALALSVFAVAAVLLWTAFRPGHVALEGDVTAGAGAVFFPTWDAPVRLEAIVSGVLVERDGCLFLVQGDRFVLPLWEQGSSYRDGTLYGPDGRPIVRVGEMLHGAGGYMNDPSWMTEEEIPPRCRPDGPEPYAQIYGVEPGPPEDPGWST